MSPRKVVVIKSFRNKKYIGLHTTDGNQKIIPKHSTNLNDTQWETLKDCVQETVREANRAATPYPDFNGGNDSPKGDDDAPDSAIAAIGLGERAKKRHYKEEEDRKYKKMKVSDCVEGMIPSQLKEYQYKLIDIKTKRVKLSKGGFVSYDHAAYFGEHDRVLFNLIFQNLQVTVEETGDWIDNYDPYFLLKQSYFYLINKSILIEAKKKCNACNKPGVPADSKSHTAIGNCNSSYEGKVTTYFDQCYKSLPIVDISEFYENVIHEVGMKEPFPTAVTIKMIQSSQYCDVQDSVLECGVNNGGKLRMLFDYIYHVTHPIIKANEDEPYITCKDDPMLQKFDFSNTNRVVKEETTPPTALFDEDTIEYPIVPSDLIPLFDKVDPIEQEDTTSQKTAELTTEFKLDTEVVTP